jgi:hypothetical protein
MVYLEPCAICDVCDSVLCVCLDMFGTLLLVYIMYAWTHYAWLLLKDVMYGCHGCYVMHEFSSFYLKHA